MSSPGIPAQDRLRRARIAVSVLFLVNGAAWANVLPRLPALREQLDLSNAALGAAIAAGPVGGIVAGALVGLLVARFGSARVTLACALGLAGGLALTGIAPAWLILVAVLFVAGASDATMDASMNAHGVLVQRDYGRSILHGFHGWWSLGSLVGGATGALMALLNVPLATHLAGVAGILAVLALLASRWLLGGREVDAAVHARFTETDAGGQPDPAARARRLVRLVALVAPIGIAGLLGVVMEESSQTWNAVYLTDVLGASAAVAALGYVALSAAMTLGRLTNDRWIDRWGNVRVARGGAALAAAGLAIVLVGGSTGAVLVAFAGFALVGLGVAPIFPAMVDAAGHRPGVRSADGIAVVSWLVRFAFFVAPVAIGVIGDAVGLQVALLLPLAAGLLAIPAASAFAAADDRSPIAVRATVAHGDATAPVRTPDRDGGWP
jgi:fucose permease